MSTNKTYGTLGVGTSVQYGKKGGYIRYVSNAPDGATGTAPAFQIRNNTDSSLLRLQVASPIHWNDVTTKDYVDGLVQGLTIKKSVKAASYEDPENPGSGDFPLTGTFVSAFLDGVSLTTNDRILLKDQINPKYNGIWTVTDAGGGNYQLKRASDADNKTLDGTVVNGSEVKGGMFCFVEQGLKNADTGWVMSMPNGLANLTTDGTDGDNLSFTQFSQAGVIQAGQAIKKTGLVLDVLYDNTTIRLDGSNKLAVKSSGITGQVLLGTSNADETAIWGHLDLGSSNAVGTTVLNVVNGGTGLNTLAIGDLIYADSTSTFTRLAKGLNNQVLGINSSGSIQYRYLNELRDDNNLLILRGIPSTTPVNFWTFTSADANQNVILGNEGSNTNIGMTVSPKGTGLLRMKTGYDSWFRTNELSLSDEALVTKGFVNTKISSIDTTRIQNAATTSAFDTDLEGYSNTPAIVSRSKVVAVFDGNNALTTGDYFHFTAVDGEVRLSAKNVSATGDVNIRFLPQNSGQVYIGSQGAGLIEGEDGFNLTIKSGDSSATFDAGNVIIRAGDATTSDFNGGNVILRPGVKSGAGTQGNVEIWDDQTGTIARFTRPSARSDNGLEFKGAIVDDNPQISGPRITAFGSSTNISIIMEPKGTTGLVRVADPTTYFNHLSSSGNEDAFVTKQYLNDIVDGQTKIAGPGLTDTANVFSVNVSANTIKIDASNNLIVSTTSNGANRILLSNANAGLEATWGALPLNDSNSVTNVLRAVNGGTGQSTYAENDILVGSSVGALVRLPKGPINSALSINTSGNLSYNYLPSLYDINGNLLVQGVGIESAQNYVTVKNAILGGSVEIGSSGTNQDINIILNPSGTGVVYARTGYTADIPQGQREVVVTKGYVDDSLLYNTDPLMRIAQINTGWQATMNVGSVTPSITGRNTYITKCTLKVNAPLATTGDPSNVLCKVMAGTDEIMNFDENDPDFVGTYVTTLGFDFASSNKQITVQFYKDDGVTPTIPVSGDIIVSVEYKISS